MRNKWRSLHYKSSLAFVAFVRSIDTNRFDGADPRPPERIEQRLDGIVPKEQDERIFEL